MAVIALVSAQGAPGVTTAALGLALAWHRPTVLVEADPAGSGAIQAGYFRGGLLPSRGTLLDLSVQDTSTLAEDLPRTVGRIPETTVDLLPGVRSHSQAPSLRSLWDPLAAALGDLERNGQDVLVDAGRLGMAHAPTKLLERADLTLLVTRTTLPALVAARPWFEDTHQGLGLAGATTGLLVVGPGQPYGTREVARALGVPVIATLAWDPVSAEVFSLGTQPNRRRFEGAALPKSLRAAASAITTVVDRNRAEHAPAPMAEETV